MPAVQALLFEDAFLFEEDATALETLIVRANNGAVDITVEGRTFAISLDIEEIKAIYEFAKVTRSLEHLRAVAKHVASDVRDAMVASSNTEDAWQLDWSPIPFAVKFVTKDNDPENFKNAVWGWLKPPTLTIYDLEENTGIWDGLNANGFRLLGVAIPDHVSWTVLHERPASVDTVAAVPEPASVLWQPPWQSISEKIAVVCKNKDERVWGYPTKPTAGSAWWTHPGGGWRLYELDMHIPGDWKESLYERPAPVGNVAAEPDSEPSTWQPDWAAILAVDPRICFITKDEDERVFGYILEPDIYGTYVRGGVWSVQPDSEYFRLPHLDNQIPGNWRESLHKRPE